jgi:hypothetical protein
MGCVPVATGLSGKRSVNKTARACSIRAGRPERKKYGKSSMNGTKRYRGMIIWLQGQGPFNKEKFVERKEIISLVDDDTEQM